MRAIERAAQARGTTPENLSEDRLTAAEARDVQRERDQEYGRTIARNIIEGSLPDPKVAPERAAWTYHALIEELRGPLTEARDRAYEQRQAEEARRRAEQCQDEGEHGGPDFFFGARTICRTHAIERGIY